MACTLLKMFNRTWARNHEDFVVQLSCMENGSHTQNNPDKDVVSSQFAIILGEYKGGKLMVYNELKNEYIQLINNRKMVQSDGRKDHFVTDGTKCERYSIVSYKSYDTRYNY